MKKKGLCFFTILLTSTFSYGMSRITIEEYKLAPDTVNLFSLGIDVFKKYKIELPKKVPCENKGWMTLRKPISKEIQIERIKRIELGNQKVQEFYEIRKNGNKIISFVSADDITENIIKAQFSWNNDWVVEYKDHIILSGIDLNKTKGYLKLYCFNFYKNKPTYLYENHDGAGIVIDSIPISLKYKNIIHYYCCESGIFNPKFDDCQISFYAQKDGYWYLVRIKQ